MKIEEIIRAAIVLAVVGGPVIKGIATALRRQAERRRLEANRERALAEQMRTGRTEPDIAPVREAARTTYSDPVRQPAPSARQRLEQLAAERQAKAQNQARNRSQPQRQRQSAGQPVQPPPMPRPADRRAARVTLPGGIVFELPGAQPPVAPPPQPEAQAPARQSKRKQRPAESEQPRRPAPGDRADQRTAEVAAKAVAATSAGAYDAARLHGRTALAAAITGASARQTVRQAIVMRELLDAPLSLR